MTAAAMKPNLVARQARHARRATLGTARGSAPVRRNSRSSEEGDRHCRNMTLDQRRQFIRDLKLWTDHQRGKQGVAPLTASTLHIAEVMLFRLQDRTTGRLDDSLSWIAHCSRRAYQTVVEAIAQLEMHGFLAVLRRCRRGSDGESPPWVQDTNLYRFEAPKKLIVWLKTQREFWRERRKARQPADDAGRRDDDAAAKKAMRAQEDTWASEEAKSARIARDQSRTVHGPGAAAYRARLEAEAARRRASDPSPESKS